MILSLWRPLTHTRVPSRTGGPYLALMNLLRKHRDLKAPGTTDWGVDNHLLSRPAAVPTISGQTAPLKKERPIPSCCLARFFDQSESDSETKPTSTLLK